MAYAKLRGKIKEVYNTQAAFAEAMGWSIKAVSTRLSGQTSWTVSEAGKACEVLGIPRDELHLYFFN